MIQYIYDDMSISKKTKTKNQTNILDKKSVIELEVILITDSLRTTNIRGIYITVQYRSYNVVDAL